MKKLNGAGLGLVWMLRREAQLVKLHVDSGDLDWAHACARREAALKKCWAQNMDSTLQTSAFLHKASSLFATRLHNWVIIVLMTPYDSCSSICDCLNWTIYFICFISSPEHEVLMVSYCGQWVVRRPSSSVVRRASCVNIWCLHSRDLICNLNLMKLDQNVCLNNI